MNPTMLKHGTTRCPKDQEPLHWHQLQGMRLVREVTLEEPKLTLEVYDAKCPKCGCFYEVKKK